MQNSQKTNNNNPRMMGMTQKLRLMRALCWILISVGSISLIISVIYNSPIFAFIGLGLVFWGAILVYIQPEEYTKKVLLDSTIFSSFENINKIITELGYKGSPIYLPPKYFRNPETNKLYISKRPKEEVPDPEVILEQENHFFLKFPEGILITPPGDQLIKIFEKRLDKSLTQADLQYFKQNLPKLFIEDLEIAEKIEIEIKPNQITSESNRIPYGIIRLKLINSILKDTYNENQELPHLFNEIGCPIFSAIACALTKITGKPLKIEEIQSNENGDLIEVTYKIQGLKYKEEPETPLVAFIENLTRPNLLSKLSSIILILLGLITLVWIAQLTWYEMLVWEKSLELILFASRTGQTIDLRIGMRLIHFLLIGLALLSSGVFTYRRKKRVGT